MLSHFKNVTEAQVSSLITGSAVKSPAPAVVLRKCWSVLLPVMTKIVNLSINTAVMPDCYLLLLLLSLLFIYLLIYVYVDVYVSMSINSPYRSFSWLVGSTLYKQSFDPLIFVFPRTWSAITVTFSMSRKIRFYLQAAVAERSPRSSQNPLPRRNWTKESGGNQDYTRIYPSP